MPDTAAVLSRACLPVTPPRSMLRRVLALALLLGIGQSALADGVGTAGQPADDSTRTAAAFAQARQDSPLLLRAFLAQMPKGADLHMHLSGAVYAETLLDEAAGDGLCVDAAKPDLAKPGADGSCAAPLRPAADLEKDQALRDRLIDQLSMRGYVDDISLSGHDRFFDSFGRYAALSSQKHAGDWLAEVTARAAAQNEQYLEIMHTPPFDHARQLAAQDGWNGDFDATRKQLLAQGLKQDVAADRQALDDALAQRNRLQHCGTAQAQPGCQVEVRFLYQVLRGAAPERVFAQTLLGFEVASSDPRWVGINFVMPEDGYLSMRDYHLQMQMLGYLHQRYPQVKLSLHAGELAPGLVPPDGLRFHIREAVELAHANRIGHGVDVMYEDRPLELLNEMARQQVMVEINLTSNDVILGIKGRQHPLPIYLRHGVPVALSTDDEGVSRIDLTHEYQRAAEEFQLDYPTLKQLARNSLSYSFLPGASLWRDNASAQPVAACAGDTAGSAHPSAACRQFLADSAKASQQWQLEHRYALFEASH